MFENTYKLVKFFEAANVISGRKKLQKMIYLLQYYGDNFNLDYYYHHYGPYSSALQLEVQYLFERGFITEKKDGDGYIYEITEKGRSFVALYEDKFGASSINTSAVELLKSKNPNFLELLSTLVYLLESGHDREQVFEKLQELKPSLTYLSGEVSTFFEENSEWQHFGS